MNNSYVVPDKIKQFWNKYYYNFGCYTFSDVIIYFNLSDEDYYTQGSSCPPLIKDLLLIVGNFKIEYFYNFKKYSEHEMLKIIDLLPFV